MQKLGDNEAVLVPRRTGFKRNREGQSDMSESRRNGPKSRLLPATESAPFHLGSLESRAAARALFVSRKASEEGGLRFEVRSILDGRRVNLDDASGPDTP